MRSEVKVVFQPEGKHRSVPINTTILETARALGVNLTSLCGGNQSCGTCKIIVEAGLKNLTPISDAEKRLLSEEELKRGYRLACATKVLGNVVVRVPVESRRGRQRLQTEGVETPVKLEPLISKILLKIPKPSLKDARADADRLLSVLKEEFGFNNISFRYNVLRKLPSALRDGGWKVTVTIWNEREIIDVEPGLTMDRNYGFAVDVGTTKMAGYLIDLNSGKLVGVSSMMNPQIPFGEDVMTRISYAMKGRESSVKLQKVVIEGVNKMLKETCERAGVSPDEVHETTIVGNTAMHHLFLGIDPKFLALSPYTPIVSKPLDIEASKLNVKTNENGNIHVLPIIAGFVGADCVAGILATGIHKSKELCFLIDVGTNTEIVVGNKEKLKACSCASGPAFEGARIKSGMRAATGAIERVWIDAKTLELSYLTIDDAKPKGICGSGLVDALAEMLKAGIIDTSGRMIAKKENQRIRLDREGPKFVIAWKEETLTKKEIAITQSDIRELQKAKAAMYTGASILMRNLGITKDDVSSAFIAGAFGTYTYPASARTVGMFPDFPLVNIRQVGNAAGTGARMALLSKGAREATRRIQKTVRYIELAADPSFQKEYLNALFLPNGDLNQFPRTMKALKGSRLSIAPSHQAWLKRTGKQTI